MTLEELQFKLEVGIAVEFEHSGQKYFIRGEKERGRSSIYFGREHECGLKYDTFTQFMDEAMIGSQYLREYIRSV